MILAGIEKVRRGVSVWIFPEGTRNKNEQLSDLLPFKEGSLKIAENLAVRLFQWRSREQRRSLRSIFRLFVRAMS